MQIGHKITVVAVVMLTAVLVLSAVPYTDAADGDTQTFDNLGEFFDEVEKAQYSYDGKGATVTWSPSSACTDARHQTDDSQCKLKDQDAEPDGNNAQRVQDHNAQYQFFDGLNVDIKISNVNFKFVPADFTLCMNSAWNGNGTEEDTLNAEFQFNTTGSVTFENCTFDKVIVSSFKSTKTTTITDCEFSNVHAAYALKDIRSPNAEITGCSFDNCDGGIYFAGESEKGRITIESNTFTNMDSNDDVNDKTDRGLIQFSKDGDYSNSKILIENNQYSGDTPIIRQLNTTITPDILDPAKIKNSNSFVGDLFTDSSESKDNTEQNPDDSGTPGWNDDDEDLPPMIRPGASSSDDDSVTIVACAAAAVVAALMAVFLIVFYKKE